MRRPRTRVREASHIEASVGGIRDGHQNRRFCAQSGPAGKKAAGAPRRRARPASACAGRGAEPSAGDRRRQPCRCPPRSRPSSRGSSWTRRLEDSDEIQRLSPVPTAVLPSRVIAHLAVTYGRPVVIRFKIGRVQVSGGFFLAAGLDRQPGGFEQCEAVAIDFRKRVAHGGDHSRDAGGEDGCSARRGLAEMAAGLEGDVKRRARRLAHRRARERRPRHAARRTARDGRCRRSGRRSRRLRRPRGWARPAPPSFGLVERSPHPVDVFFFPTRLPPRATPRLRRESCRSG